MSTGTKKREKLWHSEVKSAEGGLGVKLSSEVKDGQYGPYAFVQVHGEDEDRLFSLDSTKAAEEYSRVRAKVGSDTWVIMEGAGAKEAATLFFKDADGNPIMDDEPAQPSDSPFPPKGDPFGGSKPTQKPQAPAQGTPDDVDTDLYLDCLNQAAEAVRRFHDLHERSPSEMEMRVATTLYINRT